MNVSENAKIIKGLVSGDEKIIQSFYEETLPKIRSYIGNNSGNDADAEDIFQDALVFTYQKLKNQSLSLNCSLTTYVYAVSKNLWMNTLRKRKKIRLKEQFPETEDVLGKNALEELQIFERYSLFQRAFLRLGVSCQQLLAYFFEGKSMREISEILAFSEGYTRKKKFECKKKLIELLEKDPAYAELTTDSLKPK